MSDQPTNEADPTEPTAENDNAEEAVMEAFAAEEQSPEERIAQLEADLETAKDRMLRLAADLENTRRRAAKEKQDASQYAIKGFASDLLSVADNFERALQTAPENTADVTEDIIKNVLNGIRMTEKELLTVLERNGVQRVSPAGEPFDPNLHQAIAEVPGTGEPKGHVVDVAQVGFTIGDRVLRAAMVTVSTGAGASE